MLIGQRTQPFRTQYTSSLPGELLMEVRGGGRTQFSKSMASPTLTRSKTTEQSPSAIKELNNLLFELGIQSIKRISVSPQSITYAQKKHNNAEIEQASTYRLRFIDKNIDLKEVQKRLKEVDSVGRVAPNHIHFACSDIVPNDPDYKVQWGLRRIRCEEAWKYTTGDASVVVAVIDSGVDLDHPDLQQQLLQGTNMVELEGQSPDDGWHWEGRFLKRDNNPQDEVGHGTHVAGIIAARTNNNIGIAGISWYSKILPVRVLARTVNDSDGSVSGAGLESDIADGIRWAADNGAHIINLSLGSYISEDDFFAEDAFFVEREAIEYAMTKGCLIVAAMGNDGSQDPCYPAIFPNVIAVGALTSSNERAPWSNFGSHISLLAPGEEIFSTYWNDIYEHQSGTSMAAPHVSGIAALVKSYKPDLTSLQIADILRNTATGIDGLAKDDLPSEYCGSGCVDALAAIEEADRIPLT